MKKTLAVIAMTFCIASTAALAQNPPPWQAVPVLDVARYAGKWFEIDRLPNSAQRDRVGSVTAQYRQLPTAYREHGF